MVHPLNRAANTEQEISMLSVKQFIGKTAAILTAAVLSFPLITAPNNVNAVEHARVSVHDPSIVKTDDGNYFIIGSHLGAATSTDLMSWTSAANSAAGTRNTTFFSNIYTDLAIPNNWSNTSANYDLSGNLWAPDIVYNEQLGKYCMYLSVNGVDWHSSIVLCTADKIDGPYTYKDTIVYSGFETNPANSANNYKNTDVEKVLGSNPDLSRYLNSSGRWNAEYGTNAIDPCVFYDNNGALHMIYGSWFGGIYMLELDEQTGLRDYNVTYATQVNVSDAYMGKKIAGGYWASGEGPYIEYMESPEGVGYYYLFLSYGYFNSNGGYNMRIFRSTSPDGPYVDQNGNSPIFTRGTDNIGGTTGERLMSNYQWSCNDRPFKAQGHNSALMDDDGRLYVIYHTKFDDAYGFHEVRVHQMFINEDGWLTAAPYEYSGEKISEVGHTNAAVTGDYEFIFHTLNQAFVNETSADVETPKNITLNANGTVTGDITGSWAMENGSPYMTLTYNGVKYSGEFLVQADESSAQTQKMTFTATGNNTCVWGSKKTAYNAAEDVVDLTNSGSKLTYNSSKTSYEERGIKIGDTSLLSDVPYFIENKFSGMVLDLEGSNTADGNVQQWSKTGGSQQEWRICDLGDGWCKIVSMADETAALTVDGSNADNGLNIMVSAYTGAASQQWKLVQHNSYYGIVSRCSEGGAGLDVYDWSEESGGNINQWEYWGGDCQLWKISPVYPAVNDSGYIVRNLNSGLYLGINGTNAEQSAKKTVWDISVNSDGTYKLTAPDGNVLTVDGSSGDNGQNIGLAADTGAKGQSFTITPDRNGSYMILSSCSDGKGGLDVYNISTESGANICQWEYWGGDGQKWVLIPANEKKTMGDVNADGSVNIADLVMLNGYVLGSGELTDYIAADICTDEKINVFDLIGLRKILFAEN